MSEEKTVYHGRFLRVSERLINGEVYELAHLRGAAIIYARNKEGNFLFVRERRPHETPNVRLKPVTGFIDEGETWQSTAARELREEIGMTANKLELIRHLPLRGSFNTDKFFILAQDLVTDPNPIPNPDGDVIEEVIELSLEQAINKTIAGEIPMTADSLGLFLIKEMSL